MKIDATNFFGISDPADAHGWMEGLERVFSIMGCPDDCKLGIVVFLLEGNAYHWWELIRLSFTDHAAISWGDFRHAFYEHFYPKSYCDAKLVEFLMMVAKYEQKFIQLSRYALALMENEEDKYCRFEDGLREKIHSIVTVVYHTLFGVLFQAAMRVERSITEGRSPVERHQPCDCVGNSSQGPMNRSGYESRSFSSSRPIGFIYAASSTSHGSRQSQSFAQPSDSSSMRFTTLRTQRIDRSGRTQNPRFTSCDRYHTEPCQFGGSRYFVH